MLSQYQDIMAVFDVGEALYIGKNLYMDCWGSGGHTTLTSHLLKETKKGVI